MSRSPLHSDRTALHSPDERLAGLVDGVLECVRAVGFWSAVALPFLYLPLLVSGVETADGVVAVTVLIALNVVAVVIGRGHTPG